MAGGADIRAGRAFVELFVKNSAFLKALSDAGARLQRFGSGISSLGTKMLATGGAIVAPLALAVKSFADAGSAVADMSARTGMGAEGLSALGYAAGMTGASMGDVEEGIRKMQKTIVDAAGGSKSAADALSAVGLSAGQLASMKPEEQMRAMADGLAAIADPAARTAAAMDLFGKSGTALLPMMANGSAGLEEFADEAERLGLIMSSEDVAAADSLGDSLDRLQGSVKAVWLRIGAALAPMVEQLADLVTGFVAGVREWISVNANLVRTLAAVGAGILAAGAALVGLGTAVTVVGSLLASISTIAGVAASAITFLLSPIGLVIAGVAVAAVAAYRFRDALGGLLDPVRRVVAAIGTDFQAAMAGVGVAWDGIVDAVKAGDLELAAKIAWAGLQLVWQQGTQSLNELWLKAKYFALETWLSFKITAAEVFVGLFADIQRAWVNTTSFLATAWNEITTVMANAWNTAQLGVGNWIIRAAEGAGIISKEFADVWREELNQPLKDRMANRSKEGATRQAEINRQQTAELARITESEGATVGTLEEEKKRALAAMEAAHSSEVADRDSAIREAEAALARLRGEASAKRAEAEGKKAAGGAGEAAAALSRTAVTFSGAGLVATLAGGGREPMTDELRKATRVAERQEKLLARLADRMAAVFPLEWE